MPPSATSVSGDGWARLRGIVARVNGLAGGSWRQQMADSLGAEAKALIREGFDRSEDPYEVPWRQLKGRSGKPLEKTGVLASSAQWELNATPEVVEVSSRQKYARMMHYGTAGLPGGKLQPVKAKALHWLDNRGQMFAKSVTIPARRMIPDERGMPPRWEQRMGLVAHKVIHMAMGR